MERYWKLKENALDCSLRRTRYGRIRDYKMVMRIDTWPTGESIMNIGGWLPYVETSSHQDNRRLGCRLKVTCFTINDFKNSVILVYRAVSLDKRMIEMVEIYITGSFNPCR
jgi:hypothetical protein